MKKISLLAVLIMASLIVANQSYGEGTSSTMPESRSMQSGQPTTGSQAQQDTANQAVRLREVSKLMDMDVKNLQGEKLGDISEIVVDSFSGQIAYAIMEGDTGFLGVGDRMFAVPWKSFTPSVSGDELILKIDKETLARAPYFTRDNWPNFADRVWEVDVYKFYGVTPYWEER